MMWILIVLNVLTLIGLGFSIWRLRYWKDQFQFADSVIRLSRELLRQTMLKTREKDLAISQSLANTARLDPGKPN